MDKPIPGELKNIDVQMVSLVDKGANRRQFKIFKSADYPEAGQEGQMAQPQEQEEQQYKGLFQVIKEFFHPKKEDAAQKPPIPTFAQAMQVEDTEDMIWKSFSTLRAVIRAVLESDAADKPSKIITAIEEFKTYLLGKLNQVGITKALELYTEENVEKSGKKISAARMKALKDAQNLLSQIISEAEADNQNGEGTQVTKEEITKMLTDAVTTATKPISDRLEKLEKQEGDPAGKQDDNAAKEKEEMQNLIKEAIEKAVKPIEERLEVVEKARGISNKVPEEVKKSADDDFWGGSFLG